MNLKNKLIFPLAIVGFFLFIDLLLTLQNKQAYDTLAGDNLWLGLTAISIVEDGDLDLKNQLNFDPMKAADQISLGKNGEWYPLHEPLISLLASPFYYIFGNNGFIYFSLTLILGISNFLLKKGLKSAPFIVVIFALVVIFFKSSLLFYILTFSSDLLACFFLSLAIFAVIEKRLFLGGLWCGLSFLTRNHLGITFIPIILWTIFADNKGNNRYKRLLKIASGILPSVIVFAIYNFLLFGSPIRSSYSNWTPYIEGEFKLLSQENLFSYVYIYKNLQLLLLDANYGLWPFNFIPIILGIIGTIFIRAKHNESREIFYLSSLCMFFVLALLSFRSDNFPGSGNRYILFIPICYFPIATEVLKYLGTSVLKKHKN